MTTLSFSQLEALAGQAGFPPAMQPIMAAIALAESGGNPTALNPNDNGDTQSSYGLWQVSTGTHAPPSSQWYDPLTNAQLAYQKWQTQGLSAWGTYNSGVYRAFLPAGTSTAVSSGPPTTQELAALSSSTTTASSVPNPLAPLQTALAPLTALTSFWNALNGWLSDPLRVVKLVVGMALLITAVTWGIFPHMTPQSVERMTRQIINSGH